MSTENSNPTPQNNPVNIPAQNQPGQVEKPMNFSQIDDSVFHEEKVIEEKPVKKIDPEDDDLDEDIDDDDFEDDEDLEEEGEGEEDSHSEEKETDEEEDSEDSEDSEDGEESDVSELGEEDLDKKLKVKINGKWEEKTLRDWKNVIASGYHNLSKVKEFETNKAKQIEEIGKTKQTLEQLNNSITPAWEHLKKKDVENAIYELAGHADLNKLQVRRTLREQMLPVIAQRLGLSNDWVKERLEKMASYNRTLDLQEESEFIKSENERLTKEANTKKNDPVAQETAILTNWMADNGVSREELKTAYTWIHKKAEKENQQPDLSLNNLNAVIQNRRLIEKVFTAIEAKRPSLIKDNKFVDRALRKLKANPDWSIPKLSSWIEQKARAASEKEKQQQVDTLTRDISRKALKNKPKSAFETSKVSQGKPMRFSDYGDDDQSSLM